MTKSERFAINQWLSSYPCDMTFKEIIEAIMHDDNDDIVVWEPIEQYSGYQIADFISDTESAFRRAIEEQA